jgi:hypothetical protein
MAIGKTDKAKTIRLHPVHRKSRPATMLVIKTAIQERIPLHCSATSTLIPDSENIKPSLKKGTPVNLKIPCAACKEPVCSKRINGSRNTDGIGIIKTRKSRGKEPFRNAGIPKHNIKLPTNHVTAPNIIRDK